MTVDQKKHDNTAPGAQPSLPFDPAEFSHVRVNRSGLARMLGVSKQAVGTWVKRGLITVGVDGLINPREAVQQLMRNADPSRLRARVLRPLVQDVGTLQRRNAELEGLLEAAREKIAYLDGFWQNLESGHEIFKRLLVRRASELRAADDADLAQLLDVIENEAFIATSPVEEDDVDAFQVSDDALESALSEAALARMDIEIEQLRTEERLQGIDPHALSRKTGGEGRE